MNQALATEEVGLRCPSSQKNLNVYFQTVTPAIAQRLLESNHANNRKLKPRVVASYVRQMEKGLWKPDNGEGIKITEGGKLVDGQHRLQAIIEYGKPLDVLILSGVPEESIISIDDGVKRTLTDAMTINGKSLPNQNAINAALSCLITLRGCVIHDLHYESISSARRNTTSETINFFDKLPKFRQVAESFFTKFKGTKLSKTMPLGLALALYYIYHDIDEEICYSIFKSYESTIPMDDLREGSPTYHAITKSRRHRELKVRVRPHEHIAMFLWVYTKMLEHKRVEKAPVLVWNISKDNLVTQVIHKKLRHIEE